MASRANKISTLKMWRFKKMRPSIFYFAVIWTKHEKATYQRFLHSLAWKHRWFSGRMLACHAGGPGSIPGRCNHFHYFSFRPVPAPFLLNSPIPRRGGLLFTQYRKNLLRGYILGVLTHTTAWEQHWGGGKTLKWVSINVAWLHLNW